MKIKICGLQHPSDIDAVNLYRPDYIGFVFAPTRRFVSDETAAQLKARLSPDIPAVGVFVNEPIDHIVSLCYADTIDLVQLHGEEDAGYLRTLRAKLGRQKIIKAQKVQTTEEILQADGLEIDYLLLDTYRSGLLGGTGETFCWDLIPPMISHPYFLAGGLDAHNLSLAVSACPTPPFCLDLSSAAETDRRKDPEKIRTLIQQVRRLP